MKLTLIKKTGSLYDITNAVTKIEWSGSSSSAARQLAFDYVNAPYDNFGLPSVSTGDMVAFEYGSEGEVFYGQIFGTEKSSAVGTISYTAYDMMKNLLESQGQYNFKNLPAETIAKMVCDDAQIPIRFLYPTGVNISSLICDDMSLYDIIMAAYTKVHKITGEKFFPMIYKRGLGVYKTHWVVKGLTLSDDDNLIETSMTETMDSIVNKVKIYDDNGTQIGEVKDDNSLSLYGTYQQIYKKEKDVEPTAAAKTKLNIQPSQTIKLKCIGDINCLSCYYVSVNDTIINAVGKYWIKSDKHTWENGSYTMELDLAFEAVMDIKEVEEEKQEQAAAESISSSTTGSNMSSAASSKKAAEKAKQQVSTMLDGWTSGSLLQKNVKTDQHLYLSVNKSTVTTGRGGTTHGGGGTKF